MSGDRIEFVAKGCLDSAYLRRFTRTSTSGLDPFLYNGGISTLDALWMGVPVITLVGRTVVGRGGASILSNAGLTELIAATPEQYVSAVAAHGGRSRATGAQPRRDCAGGCGGSPLMDGKQYAADVEAAFRRMWTSWCDDEAKLASDGGFDGGRLIEALRAGHPGAIIPSRRAVWTFCPRVSRPVPPNVEVRARWRTQPVSL